MGVASTRNAGHLHGMTETYLGCKGEIRGSIFRYVLARSRFFMLESRLGKVVSARRSDVEFCVLKGG